MKPHATILRLSLTGFFISTLVFPGIAQLTNGGFHANFGVDADTKADYIKYGTTTGGIKSEDWFSTSNTSRGVIDTSNSAFYRSLLQKSENIAFVKGMSSPLYTKWNNAIWVDAVYGRDYIKADSVHLDTTSFTTSCKNGADPSTWIGGIGGVTNKNDILDVYTHMRRNGTTITDSLWLFTAASTVGTTGSRYYDVELFKNIMGYSKTTGAFTSGGPDAGHTRWIFDASGNITQTGDMILAVTYNSGEIPIIEVRIWVAKTDFTSKTPTYFKFGQFDAEANNSPYGYASILSKTGTTAFGSGAGNYTATGNDTTFSTPWGTTGKTWQANYEPLQLVEIGINLTRIGIDPALYSALGDAECGSFFKSIFYKTRTSASFASSLNDFVGPLDFMRIPVLDHTIRPDTLSCRRTFGALRVTSNTTSALYMWKTPTGVIQAASTLAINKPGTYVLQASIASGCAVGRTDSVVVPLDTLKPVATASAGANLQGQPQLFGGDPIASNYSTPFGGSKGLSYSWTGPSQFTSSIRNPLISSWGDYKLTVTELRNGCTSAAPVSVDFSVLTGNNLLLKGEKSSNRNNLSWNNTNTGDVSRYEVERSVNGGHFTRIGSVQTVAGLDAPYSFIDQQPAPGGNVYRIMTVKANGSTSYSNSVVLNGGASNNQNIYFTRDMESNTIFLNIEAASAKEGNVALYTMAGELLSVQQIKILKGKNLIPINNNRTAANQVSVAAVYLDQQPPVAVKIQ